MIPGDKVSVSAGAASHYPGQVLYGTVVKSVEVPLAPVVNEDGWAFVDAVRFLPHQFGREMVLVKWGGGNWGPPQDDQYAWWPASELHLCDHPKTP